MGTPTHTPPQDVRSFFRLAMASISVKLATRQLVSTSVSRFGSCLPIVASTRFTTLLFSSSVTSRSNRAQLPRCWIWLSDRSMQSYWSCSVGAHHPHNKQGNHRYATRFGHTRSRLQVPTLQNNAAPRHLTFVVPVFSMAGIVHPRSCNSHSRMGFTCGTACAMRSAESRMLSVLR